MNYSFWADEAYVSGIAMQWVMGKLSLFAALNAPGILYQRLQMLTTGIFFKLFGISEFTARLPSCIAYGVGVIVIFLLAKKLSNTYGGILSSFLYAFSHLNLAYATQAKPYSALETITLIIILLIVYLEDIKNKLNIFLCHVLVVGLLCVTTLIHSIGVILWTIYLLYIVLSFRRLHILTLKRSHIISFIFFSFCIIIIGYVFILPIFLFAIKGGPLLPYNNSYQSIKLFLYKYSIICTCAFFGYVWTFKKNKKINSVLVFYSFTVFVMTTFRAYIFNIRYVLTLFGIIFLYFGIFWAKVGKRYLPKKPWFIPLLVIVLLYTTGYKIVRLPQAYYNPNIDKYGDVQIANYKDFYSQLKQHFPRYMQLYVINDIFDTEYWYFGRYSNAYFMKFTTKPYKHATADAFVYGSLDDFKKIMKAHPQGLLIMEDWQSFLPDDIKEYAKKKLNLEFRVEGLREAPSDPWPLALYSWGLPVKKLESSKVQKQ